MKRLVHQPVSDKDMDLIEATAIVNPMLCKQLGINVTVVQGGEGPIPHMHIYHGQDVDLNNCSYVRLDCAEYSDHHNRPSLKLSKKQKEALVQVMESPCPKHFREMGDGTLRQMTGYEAAVDTWVQTYEDGSYAKFKLDTNGDPICPDYSAL